MTQAEAVFGKEDLYYTDLPVGEILRRAREHYNQSLADIERALRIRASQIDAIERGEYDSLPGRVYVIGFVRSYAEYLGLDPAQIVGLLKTQAGVRPQEAPLHFPVLASEGKVPQALFVFLSLIAAVTILGVVWVLLKPDRSIVDEIPPVSVLEKSIPALAQSAESAMQTASLSAQVEPQAGTPDTQSENWSTTQSVAKHPPQKGLLIRVIGNSWVEIMDAQGKAIVSKVLKAGSIYSIPDRPDLVMSMGNAGGIELEIDGENLGTFGQSGQVLKSVSLNLGTLKEKYAKPLENTLSAQ